MKAKRIVSFILTMLMIFNIVVFSASAKTVDKAQTASITVEVTTYDELKKFLYNSPNGEILVLQNDIVVEDNQNDYELVVGTWSDCTLDLNGYTIIRKTRGIDACLIEVKEGAYFTIVDTSQDESGKLSFNGGYSSGITSVFLVNGNLDIYDGNYEITTAGNSNASGTVFMVEKGYLNIYDGVFDSHEALSGDTITLWHPAYMYTVPHCNVYGGTFYGKYSNFEVSSYDRYTSYGCPYPTAYVFGGEFYIAKSDDEYAGFAYCSNGWGRVIVAGGRVFYKCLNSTDQIFLDDVSKTLTSVEYEGKTGRYYDVKMDCYVAWDTARFAERLFTKCQKKEYSYYGDKSNVYIYNKETIDDIRNYVDTIEVPETQDYSPLIWIENADNIKTTAWYFSGSAFYDGENTPWVELADYRGKVNPFRFDFRPKDETTLYIRALITKDDGSEVEEIFAIHYEEEKLNPAIDNVSIIQFDEPKVGYAPDFSLKTESFDYYINAFYWTDVTTSKTMKETDTFEAGHTYELQVWLRTNDGYKFRTDAEGYIDITATIGGKEAEVAPVDSEISALISIIFSLEEHNDCMLGDVDGDKKITIMDATAIQLHIAKTKILSEDALSRADADKDKKVSITDATAIQRYVAKVITEF